jgi:Glycosyl hydrolase family 3 C-terminal domain/Fibronectin type III-like domain
VIEAVAAACPNRIVVLETGNPVDMPWQDRVKAIVEAWYPGQAGGLAIAEILTGKVNPSGPPPAHFPGESRPDSPPGATGFGHAVAAPDRLDQGAPTTIRYDEGTEIGYRWLAKTEATPLYAFGHGLSYTSFDYSDFSVEGGDTVTATFTVTNTGDRAGADVPQLYLTEAAGDKHLRLLGFERMELQPGESRRVTVTATPAARAVRRSRRSLAHGRRHASDRAGQGRRRSRTYGRDTSDREAVRSMRAIVIVPGRPETAGVVDLPEPPASDGPVPVRTRLIGMCGADVEVALDGYGAPPPGEERLVLDTSRWGGDGGT